MSQSAPLPASLTAMGTARFRGGRYVADSAAIRGARRLRAATVDHVVACSDSRSAPEAVFDAGPGELFVVRNVAGLVPVYAPDSAAHAASAALEYGVLALEVGSIVVMGHGRCGGIAAALYDPWPLSATDFLGTWIEGIRTLAEEPKRRKSAGFGNAAPRARASLDRALARAPADVPLDPVPRGGWPAALARGVVRHRPWRAPRARARRPVSSGRRRA